MNNHQLCWVRNNKDIWYKSIIKGSENDKMMIVNKLDQIEIVPETNMLLRNTDHEDDCDNLIDLIHLNEASILNSICIRYHKDSIYTFNNNILLAVNPFKQIPIYGEKTISEYSINSEGLLPHPFLISKLAYDDLLKNNNNQSILVSGESGAGKTQTTKFLMNYITSVSKTIVENIEEKILASNPIMEAFGNAKTVRNNNSSRFGKFIKLLFDEKYHLVGGKINTYLLEKIRVTNSSKYERNFHIFYMLMHSLSAAQKQALFLDQPIENYNYLNNSTIYYRTDNVNDRDTYDELLESFEKLNFEKSSIDNIFRIISFILNLGNIQFDNSSHFIDNCAQLINIDVNVLNDLLKKKYLDVNGEIITMQNDRTEFLIARDSLAQITYTVLFNYLVSHINKNIEASYLNFIGILDIFGFEVFKSNGFEQLCINYTNEKLQNIFNKYIFEIEQAEYKLEDITWNNIDYPSNKNILNIIEHKNTSIFSYINEQSILKNGSNKKLFHGIEKNLSDDSSIEITKKNKPKNEFSIIHYAGKVTYNTDLFIEKNKNTCDKRIKSIFNKAGGLFPYLDLSNISVNGKALKNKSLIHQFKIQLNELLKVIMNTKQHYIRCIKPNDLDQYENFNRQRVYEQLKYCGVLEAIKIARAGYPIRLKIQQFIDKFYVAMRQNNFSAKVQNIIEFIQLITKSDKVLLRFQLGKTKVFLKKEIYETIVLINNQIKTKNAVIIQKNVRRNKIKTWFTTIKNTVLKFQYKWRKYLKKQYNSATRINNLFRGYISRKKYKWTLKCVIQIQSVLRMFRKHKVYKKTLAAIKIQSIYRMIVNRNKFANYLINKLSAIKIQKMIRCYFTRKTILTYLKKILDTNYRLKLLEQEKQEMLHKQQEMERQKNLEIEREKEEMRLKLVEQQKELELERNNRLEMERQDKMERERLQKIKLEQQKVEIRKAQELIKHQQNLIKEAQEREKIMQDEQKCREEFEKELLIQNKKNLELMIEEQKLKFERQQRENERRQKEIIQQLLQEKDVVVKQKMFNQQNEEDIGNKMGKLYLKLNRANEKINKLELLKKMDSNNKCNIM